jgi:hypothetical protein
MAMSNAERDEITALIDDCQMISAIKRYREVTGSGLTESKTAVENVTINSELGRKREGPPCPQCGKPLRTNKAQQCLECGADWHKKSPAPV